MIQSASSRPGRSPERALLDLLGLASRAGGIVSGTDAVRRAVREGKLNRVVLASDAASTQQDKLLPLLQARRVGYHILLTQEQLGAAIGRAPVSALGISDKNFARRAGELISALRSLQD